MRVLHRDGLLEVSELRLSRTFAGWLAGGPDVAWLRDAQRRAAADLDDGAVVCAVPAPCWQEPLADADGAAFDARVRREREQERARRTPRWAVALRGVLRPADATAPVTVVFVWHTTSPWKLTLEQLAHEIAGVAVDDEPRAFAPPARDDAEAIDSDDGVAVKADGLHVWFDEVRRGDRAGAFALPPSVVAVEQPLWAEVSLRGPTLVEHAAADEGDAVLVGSLLSRAIVCEQRGDLTVHALCAAALAGVRWRAQSRPELF